MQITAASAMQAAWTTVKPMAATLNGAIAMGARSSSDEGG
jgi:hypothetical protein